MTTVAQNFTMTAGNSLNLNFTITDLDTGDALDLSDSAVTWTLATNAYHTILTKTGDDNGGVNVTDPVNGQFSVSLIPTDTISLLGTYYHEARVVDGAGNVSTVATGTALIKATASTP